MPARNPTPSPLVLPDFEQYFSLEALRCDYEALLHSKFDFIADNSYLPPGSDRLDRRSFERQLNQHLRAIHRKAVQDRWTFRPFMEKSIPKSSGGERVISIATIRDTLVQRALYEYLYPVIDPLLQDCCVAYRRRLGAHEAIRQIRHALDSGLVHVLDADITKFFDSVVHRKFIERIESIQMDPRARRLLENYIATPRILATERELADATKPQAKYPRTPRVIGLPQGGVISGMLANLFLTELDMEMQIGSNVHVRYADDFVVCCPTRDAAEGARVRAARILSGLGLSLHRDKTQVRDANTGVDFVGCRIAPGYTRIRTANISKFKARIREVVDTHRTTKDVLEDIRRLVRRLKYKIQGPVDEIEKHDLAKHPHRRSWIGFYRVVDDERQIKKLDSWIRQQVSLYAWQAQHTKITAKEMRASGLPSLYGTMWKARRPPLRDSE